MKTVFVVSCTHIKCEDGQSGTVCAAFTNLCDAMSHAQVLIENDADKRNLFYVREVPFNPPCNSAS